mgnify:FL=1
MRPTTKGVFGIEGEVVSREIKFRAYVPSLNEMCDVTSVGQQIGVWVKSISDARYFWAFEVKLQQFTGLKDENGKEIYEGDIVKGHHENWADSLNCPNAVCFDKGGFDPFVGDDRAWDNEKSEIIGNIYENPELLGDGGK